MRLTNKKKVEILKEAKDLLIKYVKYGGYSSQIGICNNIREVMHNYDNSCYDVQQLFDMSIVAPPDIDYSDFYPYWWDHCTEKGYKQRLRAYNKLIKHFQSKIK